MRVKNFRMLYPNITQCDTRHGLIRDTFFPEALSYYVIVSCPLRLTMWISESPVIPESSGFFLLLPPTLGTLLRSPRISFLAWLCKFLSIDELVELIIVYLYIENHSRCNGTALVWHTSQICPAGVLELVDNSDSKTDDRKVMRVRVPPPAQRRHAGSSVSTSGSD